MTDDLIYSVAVTIVRCPGDGEHGGAGPTETPTIVRYCDICRRWGGGTFEGVDVAACRCGAPLQLERPKGLFCAKCNGLIAPHLRPATRPPLEERSCRRR
jgi:hypothetical protein